MPVTEESFHSLTGRKRAGFLQDLSQKLAFGHSARGASFSETKVVSASHEVFTSEGDCVSYSHSAAVSSAELHFDPTRRSYASSATTVTEVNHQESTQGQPTEEPIEDFYIVKRDYFPDDPDGLVLFKGQLVEVLDSSGGRSKSDVEIDFGVTRSELLSDIGAQHKRAIRPHKNHTTSRQRPFVEEPEDDLKYLVRNRFNTCKGQQAWVPANLLEKQCQAPADLRRFSLKRNLDDLEEAFTEAIKGKGASSELGALRSAIAKELVETEEEFCTDLQYVVDNYVKHMDKTTTPKSIRELKEPLFGNLREISEFHSSVLIEGLKYYAEEHPNQMGKAFLRLERDFDKHTKYCQTEREAEKLLEGNEHIRRYFEDYAASIDDDKSLIEHLQLPVQRINDYQYLLKDLIKQTSSLNEDTQDLQNALDLIHSIPQRAQDLQFINNIEGYKGNIKRLGCLLKHDTFTVTDRKGNPKERYLLLFRGKILICKVKKVSSDRSSFILKDIVRLSETELNEIVSTPNSFQLRGKNPGNNQYPLTFEAKTLPIRDAWVEALKEYYSEYADLSGEFDDDIQVVPESSESSEVYESQRVSEGEKQYSIDQSDNSKRLKQQLEESFELRQENTLRGKFEGQEVQVETSDSVIGEPSSGANKRSTDVITSHVSVNQSTESKQTDLSTSVHIVKTVRDNEINIPVTVERRKSSTDKAGGTDYIESNRKTSLSQKSSVTGGIETESNEQKVSFEAQLDQVIVEETSGAVIPNKSSSHSVPETIISSRERENETLIPINPEKRESNFESLTETNKKVEQITPEIKKQTQQGEIIHEIKVEKREDENAETNSVKEEIIAGLSSCGKKRESFGSRGDSFKSLVIEEVSSPCFDDTSFRSPLISEAEDSKVFGIKDDKSHGVFITEIERSASETTIESDILTPVGESQPLYEQRARLDSLQEERSDISQSTDISEKKSNKSLCVDHNTKIIKDISSDHSEENDTILQTSVGKDTSLQTSVGKDISSRASVEKNTSTNTSTDTSLHTIVKEENNSYKREDKNTVSHKSVEKEIELHCSVEEYNSHTSKKQEASAPSSDQQNTSSLSSVQKKRRNTSLQEIDNLHKDINKELSAQKVSSSSTSQEEIESSQENSASTREDSVLEKRSSISKSHTSLSNKDHLNSFTAETSAKASVKENQKLVESSTKQSRRESKQSDIMSAESKVSEEKIPHFTIKLKDTELVEQGTVTFMLKVKGDPVPTMSFFKDGKPITFTDHIKVIYEDAAKTTAEFIIEHVESSDAGLYKCVATNEHGEDCCEGRVTITTASEKENSEKKDEPQPKLLQEGEEPAFNWYKDGAEFDATERFKVMFQDEDDTLALVFQHVKPEDAGLYTCVASTASGNISCSAELTVHGGVNQLLRDPVAPAITVDLTDTEVSMGGSAMLELKLSGFPKPEVTWYKDDVEVKAGGRFRFLYEDDESIALIIKSVKEEDAGNYVVKAVNNLGEATTQGKLLVKAPPKFKQKMKDMSCMTEEPAKFTVQVEGTPMPEVKWYKDGQIVIESERIRMTQEKDGTFTLVIERVKLEDSGSYSIVASNSMGQMSEFFQVMANAPPSFSDVTKMVDMDVEQNETVLYEVKITGHPAPKVEWFKNGEPLRADGSRIVISGDVSTHSILYHKTSKHDTGRVTCRLTNEYGVKEHSAFLGVKCSPEFTQELKHVETKEGEENVELTVKVLAYPQPKIKWFIGDLEISESRTEFKKVVDGDTIKLIMTKVTEEMGETYTCQVENPIGKSSSSADVNVKFEPKIMEGLKEYHYDEGTEATFTVKCKANPKPDVKWYKDNVDVTSNVKVKCTEDVTDKTYVMKITEIDNSFTGLYKFTAKNEIAERSTEGWMYVDCKPHIISDTFSEVTSYESQPATVIVTGTGRPHPDFTLVKDGSTVVFSSRIVLTCESVDSFTYKYTISFLKTECSDTGSYTVILKNKLGEDKITRDIKIESMSSLNCPKVLKYPEDQVTIKKKPVTLSTRICGHPEPEVKWYQGEARVFKDEGVDITGDVETQTYTMTIQEPLERHRGTYTARAINEYGSCEASANIDVKVKPEIDKIDDVMVEPAGKARFQARVNAHPEAEVSWRKSGVVLKDSIKYKCWSEGDMHFLEVENCEVLDNGKYEVVAVNELGETVSCKSLMVHAEIPNFVKPLMDTDIKDHGTGACLIQVKGLPKPDLKWFKNGSELETNERIEVIEETGGMFYTLQFKCFLNSDIGRYSVIAKNIGGEAESSARIEMEQISPRFLRPLEASTHGYEGETVTIVGKVSGSPLPTVKWLKDGKEVVPDDRISIEVDDDGTVRLIIKDARPEDQGQYSLVANNQNGENKSDTYLVIRAQVQKPVFLIPFQDFTVVEGQSCKLTAKIAGFPKPRVKWMKNGMAAWSTDIISMSCSADGIITLEIEKATQEHAGKYAAILSNEIGEAYSECHLTVQPPSNAPYFPEDMKSARCVVGYPAKLETKIKGFPLPEIKWETEGQELMNDNKNKIMYDPEKGLTSLMRFDCNFDDAKDYYCVASNTEGEKRIGAKIVVIDKVKPNEPPCAPSFVHPLKDVHLNEGEELRLIAPVIGNPLPEIEWKCNGVTVIPNRDDTYYVYDGVKMGLLIHPVKVKDEGEYECILVNEHGQVSAKCFVYVRKVYQPPYFTQRFHDLQQIKSLDAKFLARVTGVPAPEISWLKDGRPIPLDSEKFKVRHDDDINCLFIRDCIDSDAGTYACIARNIDGEERCEAKLEIVDEIDHQRRKEAPRFLKKIGDCDVYEGMKAKFTACATGWPEPIAEWYKDGVKLFPSSRVAMETEGEGKLLRLVIDSVCESDVGNYKLVVTNEVGSAECLAELVYESFEARPRKPLADQYTYIDKNHPGVPAPLSEKPVICNMTDHSLVLSWVPSPPFGPRPPVTYVVDMCAMPDGQWTTYRSGIRGLSCDVTNLVPGMDYKFRIRVENNFGISDPSPYALAFRQKLDFSLPTPDYYLPHGTEFCPETSHYFPRDFDMDNERYKHAPKFLSQTSDIQYGIKNMPNNIRWFVYGYPKPKLTWYFNGDLIESGGRFDQTYLDNGQATLFINKMLDRDAGVYEAVAVNDYGESRQKVRVAVAEHPHIVQRLTEVVEMPHRTIRFECMITGVPDIEVRWFKDWAPITSTTRIKIFQTSDKYSVMMTDILSSDAGLYSCTARNIAGSVSTSAMLYVESDDEEYHHRNYLRMSNIRPRMTTIQDYYDLGDELGRGTQGIVYHAVQRSTGRSYAAKLMMGGLRERDFMLNELEMMNQLNHCHLIRLYDAYENRRSLALVVELAGGGELLDNITKRSFITESEVAWYVRQLLWGLEHMHERGFAHLGLKLGDILISRPSGREIKICDFGLTRKIIMTQLSPLLYGMPEYVAPEVANGLGVSFPADMWSLGIITHILLTGISPFRGADDKDTLMRLQSGHFTIDRELFSNISSEAQDFISKLLIFHSESRMDVRNALRHPWLQFADHPPRDEHRISTSALLNYYSSYQDWYRYANCRNWYRRRPLESAFTHPTRMVYPPGEIYTPPETPEPEDRKRPPYSFEERIKQEYRCDFGLGQSESHYQYGPDTYLLQLRDVDFPVRLRKYMKVASNRSSEMALRMRDVPWEDIPVVRERRRYMDIMDEEIDEEKKVELDQYGSKYSSLPKRLQREIGPRSQAYVDKEALNEFKRQGQIPFMREKPQSIAITPEKVVKICCLAVGDPKPVVQWFRNDVVLGDSSRVKVEEDHQGRSQLIFNKTMLYDVGLYKCVARNKNGQTICRFRLISGDIPSPPDSPDIEDISDTEILLKWKPPKDDGNSRILSYCLEYQEHAETEWAVAHDNIDHEFFCVRGLKPNTEYHFRLSCRNTFGWSPKGIPSALKRTKPEGSEKLVLSSAMRHLQQITESGLSLNIDCEKASLDYSVEESPVQITESLPVEKFSFISEISRGKFSVIVKCSEKETDKIFTAKLVSKETSRESRVAEEYSIMKGLCHERIVSLHSFYETNNMYCFILEKLQGYDILSYLTSKPEYTEEMVSKVIVQVLDAIQYLHWKGLGYLNLQPDNIILTNSRQLDIKLVDFGACQRVRLAGNLVQDAGNLEYSAPEVINNEEVMPYADVWSVGVLAYVLLSGCSPFRGATPDETRKNITYVRFRFEHLYNDITQEATRFLMLVFKRQGAKRPNIEECLDHRWLLCSEFMLKKREKAIFLSNKLLEYSNDYHTKRLQESTTSETLLNAFGMGLSRSMSHTSDIYAPS